MEGSHMKLMNCEGIYWTTTEAQPNTPPPKLRLGVRIESLLPEVVLF